MCLNFPVNRRNCKVTSINIKGRIGLDGDAREQQG